MWGVIGVFEELHFGAVKSRGIELRDDNCD